MIVTDHFFKVRLPVLKDCVVENVSHRQPSITLLLCVCLVACVCVFGPGKVDFHKKKNFETKTKENA